jgi:hypothetical protein
MVLPLSFELVTKETIRKKPHLLRSITDIVHMDDWYSANFPSQIDPYAAMQEMLKRGKKFFIAIDNTNVALGFIELHTSGKTVSTLRTYRTIAKQGIATRLTEALGHWAAENDFETIVRNRQSTKMLAVATRHEERTRRGKGPFKLVEFKKPNHIIMHVRKRPL